MAAVKLYNHLLPFVAMLLLALGSGAVQVIRCQSGYFYNPLLQACQLCRRCPNGRIIIVPCTTIADTECGPFEGFDSDAFVDAHHGKVNDDDLESDASPHEKLGDGKTKDRPTARNVRTSWKSISLIVAGFIMTITALTSILIIVARMIYTSKQSKSSPVLHSNNSVVIIKTVNGIEQYSTFIDVPPVTRHSREDNNPLYDDTSSLLYSSPETSDGTVTSQMPLFSNHQRLPLDNDVDSGISQ